MSRRRGQSLHRICTGHFTATSRGTVEETRSPQAIVPGIVGGQRFPRSRRVSVSATAEATQSLRAIVRAIAVATRIRPAIVRGIVVEMQRPRASVPGTAAAYKIIRRSRFRIYRCKGTRISTTLSMAASQETQTHQPRVPATQVRRTVRTMQILQEACRTTHQSQCKMF